MGKDSREDPRGTWVRRLDAALGELNASDPDTRRNAREFIRNVLEYAEQKNWPCLVARIRNHCRRLMYG